MFSVQEKDSVNIQTSQCRTWAEMENIVLPSSGVREKGAEQLSAVWLCVWWMRHFFPLTQQSLNNCQAWADNSDLCLNVGSSSQWVGFSKFGLYLQSSTSAESSWGFVWTVTLSWRDFSWGRRRKFKYMWIGWEVRGSNCLSGNSGWTFENTF